MPFSLSKSSFPLLAASGALALISLSSQCGGSPVANLPQAINNTSPVARIADVDVASVGSPVTLDGSASYDPDGDEIVYSWTVASRPKASLIGESPFTANNDRNADTTTVTPDVAGVYTFALRVEDPSGALSNSAFVIVEATPGLDLPIADAGVNQSGLEESEICLDGSESYDPNGYELSYQWTMVAGPDASDLDTASITTADATACITPDAPGSYSLALVVNNGIVDSEPDFAFISAGSTNQGPIAVAELLGGASCDFVQLSGANSSDPEGDELSYRWEVLVVPPESTVSTGPDAFDDAEAVEANFYADVEGEYTIQLVVTDGEDYSIPVLLDVNVVETTVNTPPVVATSPDAYFNAPQPNCQFDSYGNCTSCQSCPAVIVPLDALNTTDPDGDIFTISWAVGSYTGITAEPQLNSETGLENELTIPGPSASCSGGVTTAEVQIEVTATDCSGDSSTGLVTFVYDCG